MNRNTKKMWVNKYSCNLTSYIWTSIFVCFINENYVLIYAENFGQEDLKEKSRGKRQPHADRKPKKKKLNDMNVLLE
jgi:hypothetical protein